MPTKTYTHCNGAFCLKTPKRGGYCDTCRVELQNILDKANDNVKAEYLCQLNMNGW